jgi:hypothetical protein
VWASKRQIRKCGLVSSVVSPQAASLACIALIAVSAVTIVNAQSHALNGQIEGTVYDANRAPVPWVHLDATNVYTGASAFAVSDEHGVYRFPILPIGRFRVTANAEGFKRSVYEAVELSTGQSVLIDFVLQVGEVSETVVVPRDAPVSDPGKIEMGHVMNEREVSNLPLITLNPYTFAFLHSNVTGNRTAVPGIGIPNVHANGFSRRGNYQIDGNCSTDMTMGGVRLLYLPRTFVQEVQLTTSGMSAEFGATTGLVMNLVTPSGTNVHSGSVGYQMRRPGLSSQRFNVAPGAAKFDPTADVFTATVGGPLKKDRFHYFVGFEGFRWDLRSAARVIKVSEPDRQVLIGAGVPASAMPPAYDAPETFTFYIARGDLQINSHHRLAARLLVTNGISEKVGVGAAAGNTLQITQDYKLFNSSIAAQLISENGNKFFNELRIQLSKRTTDPKPNEHTGSGNVTIRIPNVATFGAPLDVFSEKEDRTLNTMQDNLSIALSKHLIKLGGGFATQHRKLLSQPSAVFEFASIIDYVVAAKGTKRKIYSLYTDTVGDQSSTTTATYWSAFVQDQWTLGSRLRINAGLRYDLFLLPAADPSSPYAATRKFRVDKNNFGPRLGLVYGFGPDLRPAVIRVSAGVYYDPPILNYYSRALQNNGDPSSFSFTLGADEGPEFPARLQSLPSHMPLPAPDIRAVSPNFKSMSALHANVQFEKSITSDLAFTVAYGHSSGRHIPTSRQVNCRPTGEALADGRPLYGEIVVLPNGAVTVRPCTDRILPEFNNVWVWESVGNLNYDAFVLKLTKRYSAGYQFSLNYTLAHSTDDAAEENIIVSSQWQSDPSNRRHDRSVSLTDQRHTLAGTFVGRPQLKLSNKFLNYFFNDNQFALMVRASDGERQNLRVNIDLNRNDGTLMDRPVGIRRNYVKTPRYINVDLRASRYFTFGEKYHLEFFADITNLTNTNSIVSYTNVTLSANNVNTSLVDPLTGNLRGPLPDFKSRGVTSTDSRRVQIGIKFDF